VTATTGPWAFDVHPVTWVLLAAATVAVVVGNRRLQRSRPDPVPWTRRQKVASGGAVVSAAVALTWPLADLAAHWALTALVVQRLVLVLAVPALVLLGLPFEVLRWLTRPAPVDTFLDWVRRPAVAVAWVTVSLVACLTIPAVQAMSASPPARAAIDLVVLAAGFVLWLPVTARVPGPLRVRPWGRFGYLVVQAVVPAFLSFLYIFARHPLYPTFRDSHRAIGVSPVTDQILSGFTSKLTMLLVLLTAAAVALYRAQRLDEEEGGEEPLVWADVERQLERVERTERRDARLRHPDAPGQPGGGSDGGAVADGEG
jgi:cytochrome c oxidase assembly factor CtaG